MKEVDRRKFMKIAGSSLGIGVLYSAMPLARARGEAGAFFNEMGKKERGGSQPVHISSTERCSCGF